MWHFLNASYIKAEDNCMVKAYRSSLVLCHLALRVLSPKLLVKQDGMDLLSQEASQVTKVT